MVKLVIHKYHSKNKSPYIINKNTLALFTVILRSLPNLLSSMSMPGVDLVHDLPVIFSTCTSCVLGKDGDGVGPWQHYILTPFGFGREVQIPLHYRVKNRFLSTLGHYGGGILLCWEDGGLDHLVAGWHGGPLLSWRDFIGISQ